MDLKTSQRKWTGHPVPWALAPGSLVRWTPDIGAYCVPELGQIWQDRDPDTWRICTQMGICKAKCWERESRGVNPLSGP